MEAAARVYGLPADCFVFGNGTNELIHLLARVLKEDGTPCAAVIEPAFSEYALACGLAGLEVRHPDCGVRRDGDSDEDMLRQLLSLLADVPARAAVWLANPGNPSGSFLPPASCRRLLEARPDLLWIIDEAFAAYAGPDDVSSLITQLPDNAVLLRSLTKFHAVPGVRLGYMVTRAERARRWRRQPARLERQCLCPGRRTGRAGGYVGLCRPDTGREQPPPRTSVRLPARRARHHGLPLAGQLCAVPL